MTDEFVVIYVDRKHGNGYYDRYRNNWIPCAVKHEEGRALHLDKKSGALVCYGYGHENKEAKRAFTHEQLFLFALIFFIGFSCLDFS
jgi:hypothetical protein